MNNSAHARAAQSRTVEYIDIGLDVYALEAKARTAGDAPAVAKLRLASSEIAKAVHCNKDNPRQALLHAAAAWHAVRSACPTLPVPPPQERHPLVRFS